MKSSERAAQERLEVVEIPGVLAPDKLTHLRRALNMEHHVADTAKALSWDANLNRHTSYVHGFEVVWNIRPTNRNLNSVLAGQK